jgi:hypothetical protein
VTSISDGASSALQCAELAHAADVVTAASRADLIEAGANRNACSSKHRAGPQEGKRNASDADAEQSRFRGRRHRHALLLSDRGSHATVVVDARRRQHVWRSLDR